MFDLGLEWVKIWRITIDLESGILGYLNIISEPSLPPGHSSIFPSSPPSEFLARLYAAYLQLGWLSPCWAPETWNFLLIMTCFCLVTKHMKIENNGNICFWSFVMILTAQVVRQHPSYLCIYMLYSCRLNHDVPSGQGIPVWMFRDSEGNFQFLFIQSPAHSLMMIILKKQGVHALPSAESSTPLLKPSSDELSHASTFW